MQLTGRTPDLSRRFHFTTTDRLNRFVLDHAGAALSERATRLLGAVSPALSAAPPWRPWQLRLVLPIVVAGLVLFLWAPAMTSLVLEALLALFFLAWLVLRLAGAAVPPESRPPISVGTDDELPIYTVIAALYREARSVDKLLRAIDRLDYPPEKLDVILAIEADDPETRAAIAARTSKRPLSVIVVPPGGPRTKPKALNIALAFARGAYTVVYDAEDQPEPDQLRRALGAFAGANDRLACVQARLSIDNTEDSLLTRLFTAEYAAQFDVFLGGLAALELPLPLGGSSNHFATAVLREVGGWDAWNVTEDADLGMRLARFGYRCGVIASTTYEEAPARLGPWLRQRTRWFKGWMQTWLVHMRAPVRLWRELGPAGFWTFQLVVGGNVLAALVHPLFAAGLAYACATNNGTNVDVLLGLYILNLISGYVSSAVLGWIGLSRRRLTGTAWILLLMPLHWLLLSWAAWRALYQLLSAPYRWEKTEHGLARHSRRMRRLTQSLLALERELAAVRGRRGGEISGTPAVAAGVPMQNR
jgi:cellulose synthase/poly-beta-1,6-N-acetylglucosamine synthase-like glycosyltransferase